MCNFYTLTLALSLALPCIFSSIHLEFHNGLCPSCFAIMHAYLKEFLFTFKFAFWMFVLHAIVLGVCKSTGIENAIKAISSVSTTGSQVIKWHLVCVSTIHFLRAVSFSIWCITANVRCRFNHKLRVKRGKNSFKWILSQFWMIPSLHCLNQKENRNDHFDWICKILFIFFSFLLWILRNAISH